MASREIKDCDIKLQEVWAYAVAEWQILYPQMPKPFLTCTHRPCDEQEVLFLMNKNGKDDDDDGKIDEADEWRSNARAGQSKHNFNPSQAFDVAFKDKNGHLDWSEELFRMFAAIIKPKGIKWGGDWKKRDTPHFEI